MPSILASPTLLPQKKNISMCCVCPKTKKCGNDGTDSDIKNSIHNK